MSKISTIYDAVITEVSGLFPNKTRISNAYDLENTPGNFLRDGWGMRINTSSPRSLDLNKITQIRVFTIILTEEVYAVDTSQTAVDSTAKSLLEDVKTLIEGMEACDDIGEADAIDIISYSDTSDIFLTGESRRHHMAIEVNFNITYSEDRI